MANQITLRSYKSARRYPRAWVIGPKNNLRSYRRITPASVRRIERLAAQLGSRVGSWRGSRDLTVERPATRCVGCRVHWYVRDCYLVDTDPDMWSCPECGDLSASAP